MAEWNEAEAEKVLAQISKRAATDPEFRKEALSDPKSAVKKLSGQDVPPNFKLRFVENQGANLTLVLPDPVSKEGELSDSELEQVAGGGGRCGGSCAASCVFSSIL